MERIYGYHATDAAGWEGMRATAEVHPSIDEHEWLGEGVYFWQAAPARAFIWKRHQQFPPKYRSKSAEDTVVLEFEIFWDSGVCLDLFEVLWYPSMLGVEERVLETLRSHAHGDEKKVKRWLALNQVQDRPTSHRFDCQLINVLCAQLDSEWGLDIYAVRAAFQHRHHLCEGSYFRFGDHVQIVVRHFDIIDPERDFTPVNALDWLDRDEEWLRYQPEPQERRVRRIRRRRHPSVSDTP